MSTEQGCGLSGMALTPIAQSTSTTIKSKQHDSGNVWRFVNLPDLKTNLPTKGSGREVSDIVNCVNAETESFYVYVRKNGALNIGCQRFTVTATKHIFKAMGLRRAVGTKPKTAKPVKLKARAAAAKRKKH